MEKKSLHRQHRPHRPGSHWLAIFTKKHTCEVMESYGLPLRWYKPSDVVEWVFENFEIVRSNATTLQEMNSQSCGQYALMYLKAKARGQSIQDFISVFKKGILCSMIIWWGK